MKGTLMISTNKLTVAVGIIISFLSVSVYAQSADPELNHFTVDRISFDYPAGYSLKDESTPEAHQLIITRQGSSVELTIIATRRRMVMQKDLPSALDNFREPMLKNVSLALGQDKNSPERTSFQTQIGTKQADGIRLRSTSNGKKTGEVICMRWNFSLIGLAFVRSDADEAVAAQLWQTVSSSFRVNTPVMTVLKAGAEPPAEGTKIEGGVLNGKALGLPPPAYPAIARAAHASGTVTVQVLIDEEGNVVAAHAVDGHPLLQAAAVAAARQARFSPTLFDGEPVKVTGVIQYKFVRRE